ncbi:MAG: SCO1664 family protein [Anaerolineales bacterium]|nr:SCO1664 family protein [Anaerolineales bacterium]
MGTSTDRGSRPTSTDRALEILRKGEAEVRGLFRLGSNDAFLCRLRSDAGELQAVYKPVRGERPLWDFPRGSLAKREAAAFETARLLGWDFVPPTVFRRDGPLGPGSFQEYLNLDLEQNYFLLRGQAPAALRRVAAFDILVNNADRKAMHVLRDDAGRIWLIDHGLCFHRDWKLRTVIWDFAGQALPDDVLQVLAAFAESKPDDHPSPNSSIRTRLKGALSPLISGEEISAVRVRAKALWKAKKFPLPGPGVSIPWPVLA